VPHVTRKGLETIIAELAPTEPKVRTAKPDDFLDTRFVSQLEGRIFQGRHSKMNDVCKGDDSCPT